ncbi:MAG: acyl--CoA ligase [Ruminococcaceae bacterium]|nr:acyl--CoA ligase [Oscillospiraceae bacterium]
MIKYSLECLDKVKRAHSYKNIFSILCEHGNRSALEFKIEDEIKIITFEQMEFVAEYVADKLIKYDIPKNSFIALKLENCPEWIACYWGILMAGHRPFLMDYRLTPENSAYYFEHTGAKTVITGNDTVFGENITTINAFTQLLSKDHTELYNAANVTKEGTLNERLDAYDWGDEMAMCTSGTTGGSKIYTYNGEALGYQILSARPVIEANERVSSDRTMKNLAFLPLHHIFGFMACYLWYSFFAGALVFPKSQAPSVLFATCKEHKVTHLLAVPLLVNSIVKGVRRQLSDKPKYVTVLFNFLCNVSIFLQKIEPEWGISVAKKLFKGLVLDKLAGESLEVIICGGGHVLPDCMRTINAMGYYTLCGFGMTEVGITSLEYRRSIKKRLAGCVGVPIPSAEYKIVPLEDSNDANVGELYIRGKSIHSGRIKDGQVLPPDVDENGWFRTGDIGRLDSEGALYIEGRVKDVIINESGENVYPDELEDYFEGFDGISQFTVVGIKSHKDDKYENISVVFKTDRKELTEEYKKYLVDEVMLRNDKLPFYKKVTSVYVTCEGLPLSGSMKVKRIETKRLIENGEGAYVCLKSKKEKANV